MYWLFTDETNVTAKEGDFFIYGGLMVTAEQMVALNSAVSDIRIKYGYRRSDKFKFQTASRPKQVTQEQFKRAKAEAVATLEKHGAVMVVYVVLHEIAKNKTVAEMTQWALNALVSHFALRFLEEKKEAGVVCIDRLDPNYGYDYMTDKFLNGIKVNGRHVYLDRIIHYSMSCDGASHMSSLTDIALGSIRYSINFAGGKGNEEVARTLMAALTRTLWHKERGSDRIIGGYGFLTYPQKVQVPDYKKKYDDLLTTLSDLADGK